MQIIRILKLGWHTGWAAPAPRFDGITRLILLAVLALVACDAGSTTTPPRATPETIRIDQASLSVDEGASTRVRVLITESNGSTHELSGGNVAWTVRDPDIVSVAGGLVTGLKPGSTQIKATFGGHQAATADVTVLTVPGVVELLDGDRQHGIVGQPLLAPIRMQVLDRQGRPMSGVKLQFWPVGPGSSVSPESATSGSDGLVEGIWTLGTKAGAQALDVSIAGRTSLLRVITATAGAGPVARVEVSPSDALVNPGGKVRYSAAAVDQFGNVVESAGLEWGVEDPSVATISPDGIARALAEGETSIEATYTPATTGITQQAPPATRGHGRFKSKNDANTPEQVDGLRSPSQSSTTVTLSFAQVGDGTGSPANYEVRYAPTPIGGGFAGATVARTGSCQSPIIGTAIGATRTCVVEGLQSGTQYDFQVVAFRGTGSEAVFGSPSNVATASTSSTAPAVLEIVGGNNQTAAVGSDLPNPLTVRVKSAGGAPLAGITVQWNVTSGGGTATSTKATTDALGLAEAEWRLGGTPGTNTVQASVGGQTATFTANGVGQAATPVTIAIAPGSATIQKGQVYQLLAVAYDSQGSPIPGVYFNWSTSDATRVTVSSSGMLYGIEQGSATVRATAGSAQASITVTVGSPTQNAGPASVAVTPSTVTVQPGQAYQMTAQARDAQGNVIQGASIAWSTSDPTRATISSNGLLFGVSSGSTTVRASVGSVSGTAAVQVQSAQTSGALASITVTPGSVSVKPGQTLQLTAQGRDAQGNVLTGLNFTWSTTDATRAVVYSNGLLFGISLGTASIRATSGGITGTASVRIESTPGSGSSSGPASISVSPGSFTIQPGQSQQLSAQVRDAQGNILSGTNVSWSSSDGTRATVSSSGQVYGVSSGNVTISASTGSVTGSASGTIQNPSSGSTSSSVTVIPGSITVKPGQTYQLKAEARDAQGNLIPGATFTWSTSDGTRATVSGSGLVFGVEDGWATIKAVRNGVQGTSNVTVSSTLAGSNGSLSISPDNVTLQNVGATRQLSVTAVNASGSPISNPGVVWSSSNSGIVSISGSGMLTARGVGTVVITAAAACCASDQITVSVGQPVASSISVDPTSATLSRGQSMRLQATLRDAQGNAIASGGSVTWQSQNPGVASIASDGTVSGQAAGSTTVVASVSGMAALVPVSVQNDPPPPPPPSSGGQNWPNEPSGSTVSIDESFNSLSIPEAPAGRWEYGNNFGQYTTIASSNGPVSNPGALRFIYNQGRGGGDAPGNAVITDPKLNFGSYYIGFWVRWSLPWENHPTGTNKIVYWGEAGARATGKPPSQFYLNRRGPYIDATLQYGQSYSGMPCGLTDSARNIPAEHCGEYYINKTRVDDGQWHLIEARVDASTNAQANGRLRVWVDGNIQFDLSNARFSHENNARFYGIAITPVWGGVGGIKPQTDWLEFDHLRVSGR